MAFLLKDAIHQSLVDSVYNEFLSRRSNYYYYIGRVVDWDDVNNPDSPASSGEYESATRSELITVKRINVRDVSYIVPRRNWQVNTVYDMYDPDYSVSRPSYSGATSLKTASFYVLTSTFGVYKCIFNNNNSQSTIEPFGTDVTPVTYGDGYIWKYLYTIPLSSRNRFLTTEYMPVQRAVQNSFYSNGEISSIVIDNPGSGYSNNSQVTLTVNGTFLGLPGNSIANLTPVLSANGEFVSVIIEAAGNNYSNASIVITDNFGAGNSYYKSVSNVLIYNVGTGYTSAVRNNTSVSISTSGTNQPSSNAAAVPLYSLVGNNLVGLQVISGGSGYSPSVRNNTTVSITTTGSSLPTSNATANIFYNDSAILTPVIYNGRIDRVLISDPGINYSTNNLTSITLAGDGVGAVLQPAVNSSGEIEDIIIVSRGEGYTYADIDIIGPGTNANATVNLSLGDLYSVQGVVELSAVDGGIYAFRVINGGNNYSTATVSVYGDGSGFLGNTVIVNNSISYITVTNTGFGYTFANVIITGDGGNANVKAIISPVGGHGSDPVKELFSDTLLLYSTISNEKNHGIAVNNDYRQFGILKNVKKFDSDQTYTESLGTACYLYTLSSTSSLSQDSVLTITDDNNQLRRFIVVEVKSSTNQVLVINKDNYDLQQDEILIDQSLNSYTVLKIDAEPDINNFSGELLFIDNRTAVSYNEQQIVTLRTIIQL